MKQSKRPSAPPPPLWQGLPWLLAAALAGIAPWLLGGRAAIAHPLLGALAWATALAAVLVQVPAWLEWRRFGEYHRRRQPGSAHPLRPFALGLLRALPLWLFIALLWTGALNPVYQRSGEGLVLGSYVDWLPLVIDPDRSRPGIWFLSGLVAAAAMLANPALKPPRAWVRAIMGALLLNALVLAWTGLVFRFMGNGLVLGRFEPRAGYFFASFFYKNHWAAFALLYCGVAGLFLLHDLKRWGARARGGGAAALALVAILFLLLTIPVAESRSGILLAGLLLLAGIPAALLRLPLRRPGLWAAGATLACGGMLVLLSAGDLQSAWQRTSQQAERAGSLLFFDGIRLRHGPEVCLDMLADRPLWGWGYLSFGPLFPVYATDAFRDGEGRLHSRMEFAHSDWLQHAAEFGIAGLLLLAAGAALLGRPLPHPCILAATALLALFALWDFPFSNPAVLTSAVVLWLAGRHA